MKALSLFTGIGGIDLALESEGVDIVAMCEIDPFCQSILKKQFPNTPIHDDIRSLNGSDYVGVDMVVGGFPCQPFSTSGKQKGEEDERYLWDEMYRIIVQCRPNWVLGENVKGLLSTGIERVVSDLEKAGYRTRVYLLSAESVGAIHIRERTFIVGVKEERFSSNTTNVGLDDTKIGGRDPQIDERSTKRQNQNKRIEGRCGLRSVLPFKDYKQRWKIKPDLCRVHDGVSRRLDKPRIHALGNAVSPQQVLPLIRAIVRTENLTEADLDAYNHESNPLGL